jgi:4-aminobutyrate aminotransferase
MSTYPIGSHVHHAPIVHTPTSPVPHLVTNLPGPKAAEWLVRDAAVMSPSYTRVYPLVVARGYGSTIEDVDGNRFLDFTAGIAVNSTGHCHPEVVAAIVDQAQRLIHMSGTDFYYAPEIELAERLARLAPGHGPKRVFFTNSGTEAIEAALKLARFHTRRQRIIAFYGAFHGRTYGSMSISGSKSLHQRGFGPLLPGVHRLAYNCSRQDVESLFATAAPADEVAAIFVEPIQGEGGYRAASPEFLPMLREVCDRHGILLVMDEIQSGLGRSGRMFACQHFGPSATPDVLCIAKGIASGLPLGAIITRAELMDWVPGSHASTFGGNPVCCRAALATLDLIEREYRSNAAARGDQLAAALELLANEHRWLRNVRGLGLMRAVDVMRDGELDPVRRDRIIQAAFHRGLLLLPCGKAALRFCPPLCITPEEVATGISLLREVVAAETAQNA